MKIYLSAPQNTPYQCAFVHDCEAKIARSGFEVSISTDSFIDNQSAFELSTEGNGKPLVSDENNSGRLAKSSYAHTVFKENFTSLAKANALVALLDGSQVDDRVACEIGVFYGLMLSDLSKKGVLGLATDTRCLRRRDSTYGINIFTLGTIEEVGKVFETLDNVIEILISWNKNLK